MAKRKRRLKRDVEKPYPLKQFTAKLRRLADASRTASRSESKSPASVKGANWGGRGGVIGL